MDNNKIKEIIELLVKNNQLLGLLKLMQPRDLFNVFVQDFELSAHDAQSISLELLKQVKEGPSMGIGAPDMPLHQFPPQPMAEPQEFPYDDMTLSVMDPKNKVVSKPLTSGFDKKIYQFEPDNTVAGNYMKSAPHFKGNSMNTFSNGYFSQGIPGLSSAPLDKETIPPTRGEPKIGVTAPVVTSLDATARKPRYKGR